MCAHLGRCHTTVRLQQRRDMCVRCLNSRQAEGGNKSRAAQVTRAKGLTTCFSTM